MPKKCKVKTGCVTDKILIKFSEILMDGKRVLKFLSFTVNSHFEYFTLGVSHF